MGRAEALGPATAIGVLMGGALAAWLSGDALSLVFGVLALAVALYLGLGREEWRLGNELPKGVGAYLAAGAIGLASALMGIGGGTFAVALMTLFATPIHRAVATASGLGFVIAVPGAIAFAIAGWNEQGLPPLSSVTSIFWGWRSSRSERHWPRRGASPSRIARAASCCGGALPHSWD